MTVFHSGITDLVPSQLRADWTSQGYYPNKSVFHQFKEKVSQHPSKAAVVSLQESISYQSLYDASLVLANHFRSLGIVEGDVVAYQLTNHWYACAIDLAASALGAIVSPFPPGRSKLDILSLLNRSRARMFIGLSHFAGESIEEMMTEIQPQLLSLRTLVKIQSSSSSGLINPPTERQTLDEQYPINHINTCQQPNWINFSALLKGEPISETNLPDINPNAPLRFLVSSGTESEPKLIAYSHNALTGGRGRFLKTIHEQTRHLSHHSIACPPSDNFCGLYLIPLGSAFGSTATFGALCYMGGTIALMERFNVHEALAIIDQLNPTHLLGVPTMFQKLMAEPALKSINKQSIQALISGGSVSDEETIRRCRKQFDCHFINLYGSADGVNCHNLPSDHPDTLLYSVGKPNPTICEFKIVNEAGESLASGEVGEIYTRGPISPMQYVNAPELDKRYRNDNGWVKTGDLGLIDQQGYLILSGRKKDIIIRGGANISPVQIEKLATAHPHVLGALCLPVPDPIVGQRVCLCIMLQPKHSRVPLNEINQFLYKKGLEKNKLPEYLKYYRQFPLNPAGKVDKQLMSEQLNKLNAHRVERAI